MSCIYKGDCDLCGLFDAEDNKDQNYTNSAMGFSTDGDGACAVDDDPDPGNSCESFEPVDDGF